MSQITVDPFLPEPPGDSDDYTRRMHLRQGELWRASLDAVEPLQRYKVNGDVLTADSDQQNGVKWSPGVPGPTGPTGPAGPTGPTGPAGSGGTPGGSNTQVQFNDSGAFGGDAGLTYNKTTDVLSVVGGLLGSGAYPQGEIRGVDFYTVRAASSGAVFFGSSGTTYFFQDGAPRFHTVGAPVSMSHGLNVNVSGVGAIGQALRVRTGSQRNIAILDDAIGPVISAINDASSAFINWQMQASAYVGPMVDGTLNFGDGTHRWQSIYAVNGTIVTSDARLKTDVQDSALGLAFINDLRPVSYRWIQGGNHVERVEDGVEVVPAHYTIENKLVPPTTRPKYKTVVTPFPGVRPHYGLIAQEVADSVQRAGVTDFAGYVEDRGADGSGTLSLRYDEFIAPLIKAVQELSAQVDVLHTRIKALEAEP